MSNFVLCLALLSVFVLVCESRRAGEISDNSSDTDDGDDSDDQSEEYTRNDIVRCAQVYLDGDGDGRICNAELVAAKAALLGPLEKFVDWFYPTGDIMEHCDFDRDGFISQLDFEQSWETCLNNADKRSTVNHYVCARAKALSFVPTAVDCDVPSSSSSSSSSD